MELGKSSISVETFLSHSTATFRKGPLCAVFQRISGSENFMPGRALSRLSINIFFCLTTSKISVVEPFRPVFQKTPGGEKVCGKEGGEIMKTFRRKFFVSQQRKVF